MSLDVMAGVAELAVAVARSRDLPRAARAVAAAELAQLAQLARASTGNLRAHISAVSAVATRTTKMLHVGLDSDADVESYRAAASVLGNAARVLRLSRSLSESLSSVRADAAMLRLETEELSRACGEYTEAVFSLAQHVDAWIELAEDALNFVGVIEAQREQGDEPYAPHDEVVARLLAAP